MGEVEEIIELIDTTIAFSSAAGEEAVVEAGGNLAKAMEAADTADLATVIDGIMGGQFRASALNLRESENILQIHESMDQAINLARLTSKRRAINSLLLPEETLSTPAELDRAASLYGIKATDLGNVGEEGSLAAKVTDINTALGLATPGLEELDMYGELLNGTRAGEALTVERINGIKGLIGEGEFNIERLTEIRSAVGLPEDAALDVEKLDQLKKAMRDGEVLNEKNINSFKDDFKLTDDENLFTDKSQGRLKKIEGLNKDLPPSKVREFFKRSNGDFESISGKINELDRAELGEAVQKLKTWARRRAAFKAGVVGLGVPAAILTFMGSRTHKCRSTEACCEPARSDELAVECGENIALYGLGTPPVPLPGGFQDWLGTESSPPCNFGPCKVSTTEPEKCWLEKGYNENTGTGFPTYGRECTPGSTACPKDNEIGYVAAPDNKSHHSWPYAIDGCDKCPDGVGKFRMSTEPWDDSTNIVNPINCKIAQIKSQIWGEIRSTLMSWCQSFDSVLGWGLVSIIAIIIFKVFFFFRPFGKDKTPKITPTKCVFFLFLFCYTITAICLMYLTWKYKVAFENTECVITDWDELINGCSTTQGTPPKELSQSECESNTICLWNEEEGRCRSDIEDTTNIISNILFGGIVSLKSSDYTYPGIWQCFIYISVLVLIFELIMGLYNLGSWISNRDKGSKKDSGLPDTIEDPKTGDADSKIGGGKSFKTKSKKQKGGGLSFKNKKSDQWLILCIIVILLLINYFYKQREKIKSYKNHLNNLLNRKQDVHLEPLKETKFETVIGGQYVSF